MLDESKPLPAVWAATIGGSAATPLEWILEPVREFVRQAARTAQASDSKIRDRPLIAIPFVGTRAGGKKREKGAVAFALVPVLVPLLRQSQGGHCARH